MHKWICESFWMESWLAVHLLIKRSRSNRAWPSLALSSPESRSTRSVGRVYLASIISSMIKFVSLFEIDDNVVVIMSHSGRKHPCQNLKIVTKCESRFTDFLPGSCVLPRCGHPCPVHRSWEGEDPQGAEAQCWRRKVKPDCILWDFKSMQVQSRLRPGGWHRLQGEDHRLD